MNFTMQSPWAFPSSISLARVPRESHRRSLAVGCAPYSLHGWGLQSMVLLKGLCSHAAPQLDNDRVVTPRVKLELKRKR